MEMCLALFCSIAFTHSVWLVFKKMGCFTVHSTMSIFCVLAELQNFD